VAGDVFQELIEDLGRSEVKLEEAAARAHVALEAYAKARVEPPPSLLKAMGEERDELILEHNAIVTLLQSLRYDAMLRSRGCTPEHTQN
jgi:hypothetical protein